MSRIVSNESHVVSNESHVVSKRSRMFTREPSVETGKRVEPELNANAERRNHPYRRPAGFRQKLDFHIDRNRNRRGNEYGNYRNDRRNFANDRRNFTGNYRRF